MTAVLSAAADIPAGSPALRASFVALAAAVAALFAAGIHWSSLRTGLPRAAAARRAALAAAVAAAWMAATALAAARGALHFEPPPTMLVVVLLGPAIALAVALSPVGRRLALGLPVAALVGFQGFRVAVETLLHRAYVEGLMPVQMSWSGRNFDVVSGVTALALGAWLATGERRAAWRVVLLWNTLGAALLANILGVAMLSAPTPFRAFSNEPANVWITRAPWVWLPAVMVLAAVMGHALVYRRLWLEARAGGRVPASRSAAALAMLAVIAALGCADPAAPATGDGSLAGTVTLLGPGGPTSPAGVRVFLFDSLEDLDARAPAYETALERAPGAARTYGFEFAGVAAGEYYVLACFDFGCGEYRSTDTGELLRVRVRAARASRLEFGL
ncbi:MAG: hypothetical protein ACJ8AO_05930 [Gemmatimonadaceae bacterium]